MSFSGRVNGALAATVLLLAGTWLATGDSGPPAPRVSDWLPGDISELSLERDGNVVWRLARIKGEWRMLQPSSSAVDQARVEVLLGVLGTLSLQQLPFIEARLADYGLDRPRFRLVTDRAVLDFGRREPLTGGRYLRVGGALHLIGDGYLHHLLAAPSAWMRRDA